MTQARRPLTEALGVRLEQAEVDFVIPDVGVDIPLGIDPFLLFKSRDQKHRAGHDQLLAFFNEAMRLFRTGHHKEAHYLIDFPEASEISMGYRTVGKSGTGMGTYLNQLLLDTLSASPALVERGVRHIEEMQLVALGIGPDRISDMTANILKRFLIEYTQRQCSEWSIPTRTAPVHHFFDFKSWSWEDSHDELPVNPQTGQTVLFVPKRLVRVLPWINFNDYMRREFAAYLRAKHTRGHALRLSRPRTTSSQSLTKQQIVEITRREVQRIDRYVDYKERIAHQAQPDTGVLVPQSETARVIDQLLKELTGLEAGAEHAHDFHDLVLRILGVLFNPELTEGKKQQRTEHGTEIRDIIFVNESDIPFWDYIRNEYGNFLVVVEVKNTKKLDNRDIDQLANYLGDSTGRLGILVSRSAMSKPQRLKTFSTYNRLASRRVVLHLADEDLERMLLMKKSGNEPTRLVQNTYRAFMTAIQ